MLNKELCDFVICELCLKKFKCITNTHLKYAHDTDTARYKEMFPEAEIFSEKRLNELSIQAKENWLNPQLRNTMIINIKKATNTPEVKQLRSDLTKELWADSNSPYRTEGYRERFSERAKLLHQDPRFKSKHRQAIKESLKDWRIRYKISYAAKTRWDSPDHIYNSPEYREKLSLSQKKKMKSFKLRKQISNKLVTHGRRQKLKYKEKVVKRRIEI